MTKSKLQKAILGLLILAGLCFFSAFLGYPCAYILCFFLLCYVGVFLLVTNLAWWMLPAKVKKKFENRKISFNLIVVVCLILLFVGYKAIDALIGSFNSSGDVSEKTASIEHLRSLPYLDWVPAENSMDKSGVTKYDPNLSFKGVNIYSVKVLSMAHLLDMSGKVLHTWKLGKRTRRPGKDRYAWPLVELCKNGDLLAFAKDRMLVRLDWNSNIKWKTELRAHHDLCIAENGDIYVISREDDVVFWGGLPVPILKDYIAVLSPSGQIKKRIPIFKAVENGIPFDRIVEVYRWIISPQNLIKILWRKISENHLFVNNSVFDVFHTNTVELMNRDIENLCKKGDILISVRELDWVGIMDSEGGRVVWSWGPGELDNQHHPNLLDNGNILIFDNGFRRGYSRIIELDPLSKKIVWEYKSKPKEQFFSPRRGSSQRLPNGNTLITESDSGVAFEVTKNGDIVWEFYNFHMNKKAKKRLGIYRLTRIVDPENYQVDNLRSIGYIK